MSMAFEERSHLHGNDYNVTMVIFEKWKTSIPHNHPTDVHTHYVPDTTHRGTDTYTFVLGKIIKLTVELLNIFIV